MTTTNQDFVSSTRPAFAPAASYEIDPAHSRASFAVRHMMVATVRGEFGKLAGTITLDDAQPERSRVEATIDASSVNTRNEMRDNHLRSADFFDVAKFPQLTFRSTAVRVVGSGELRGHRRPDHPRGHQAGGAGRRGPGHRGEGPLRQHQARRDGDDDDQPQGLRPRLEPGPGGGRRDGRQTRCGSPSTSSSPESNAAAQPGLPPGVDAGGPRSYGRGP